ncbi:MAG: phospho-sugar mutase [Lachnospiraceae bacterium]|nr:phospho-sugar mutase [Lachnospiraceae bacterium]
MNYKQIYEEWLRNPYFDTDTNLELESIKYNEKEIEDRFYKDLKFGTAGLRGIIGAGTNRINKYVVRRATQGLANYIMIQGKEDMGVAIAFDSRRMSPQFAKEAALTLCANGIKAYLFDSLRPTPELSFAVRYLECVAGINITASHNPPEYNGYKVYWEDGAQITPPNDVGIMREVGAIADWENIKVMTEEQAKKQGLLKIIGKEVDDAYMEELKKLVLHPECIKKHGKDITVVYTPLHGTGNIPARRVLKEIGFDNVYVVPEQELPNGEFPTVSYPNPEAAEAFELALALAKEKDADLVLATDPDADRLGCYVKDSKGEYHVLTGNMSGCLLADYEISQMKALKKAPKDGCLIKTIVTSNMADAIAKLYKVGFIEVLTGFKYIGEQILKMEQTGKGHYLFGFEESYGCLIGTHARDKDAIVATMALCECAAYYKDKGMTMWDAMIDLYERVGYYMDGQKAITLAGVEGADKIKKVMDELRNNPPKEMGGYKVTEVRDYQMEKIIDIKTGKESPTGLPVSNVLYFDMEDGVWVCARPSGTEPKIKFYYGIKGKDFDDAVALSEKMGKEVVDMINKMIE